MKRCSMLSVAVLAVFATLCGCAADPETDDWTYGGYESFDNSYFGETQEASNWCWAACISTVLRGHMGAEARREAVLSQEQIVERMFEGDMPDESVTAYEMVDVIDGFSFIRRFEHGTARIRYTFHARSMDGVPTPEMLRDLLADDEAAILLIPHHAVVLTGFKWEHFFEREERVREMEIFDPWPRRGRMTITRDEFAEPYSDYTVDGVIAVRVTERTYDQ